MNVFKLLFFSLACFILTNSYAQQLSVADSLFMNKSNEFVKKILSKEIKGNKYIIFSVGNENQLILIKKDSLFKEYYIHITKKDTLVLDTIYTVPNSFNDSMFNKDKYHKGVITFESDFYKDGYEIAKGNKTYFALKDIDGESYGDVVLSFFIAPIPIDAEIYLYFVNRTLYYVRKTSSHDIGKSK